MMWIPYGFNNVGPFGKSKAKNSFPHKLSVRMVSLMSMWNIKLDLTLCSRHRLAITCILYNNMLTCWHHQATINTNKISTLLKCAILEGEDSMLVNMKIKSISYLISQMQYCTSTCWNAAIIKHCYITRHAKHRSLFQVFIVLEWLYPGIKRQGMKVHPVTVDT
jgi:hypothetical protein